MNEILKRIRNGTTTGRDAVELENRIMRLVLAFFIAGICIGALFS